MSSNRTRVSGKLRTLPHWQRKLHFGGPRHDGNRNLATRQTQVSRKIAGCVVEPHASTVRSLPRGLDLRNEQTFHSSNMIAR